MNNPKLTADCLAPRQPVGFGPPYAPHQEAMIYSGSTGDFLLRLKLKPKNEWTYLDRYKLVTEYENEDWEVINYNYDDNFISIKSHNNKIVKLFYRPKSKLSLFFDRFIYTMYEWKKAYELKAEE